MAGNPKESMWSRTPEGLRNQIKLNVRLAPWRMEQVRRLAKRLKKTQGDVIIEALDALEARIAADQEAHDSWREVEIVSRKSIPVLAPPTPKNAKGGSVHPKK